jgi:folate-binding protein YgfZ
MQELVLRDQHKKLGAELGELYGCEVPLSYGNMAAEYHSLTTGAAVLDLGYRSRVCMVGSDRQRFLNGQVTNKVEDLRPGQGCYAALITAKGKMQSDLNVFILENEVLLDFEPGLTTTVTERLDKYIIADDVQLVDVSPHYGMLSVQGPRAHEMMAQLGLPISLPDKPRSIAWFNEGGQDHYIANQPRFGSSGFDLFFPNGELEQIWQKIIDAGVQPCGWRAAETTRIEQGIPRVRQDIDETNLPPEAGLEKEAIHYNKGCYIGQEVIARLRTYGQVTKALRGLILDKLPALPTRGAKLFFNQREVGYLTSAIESPRFQKRVGLGYVRKECNQPGTELQLELNGERYRAVVSTLPFREPILPE